MAKVAAVVAVVVVVVVVEVEVEVEAPHEGATIRDSPECESLLSIHSRNESLLKSGLMRRVTRSSSVGTIQMRRRE